MLDFKEVTEKYLYVPGLDLYKHSSPKLYKMILSSSSHK